MPDSPDFAERLIAWQLAEGRHDLPWQGTGDAYRVWLSEVMLQQTQVATVIPYYHRFLSSFPDVTALAESPLERVLELWSGLGYYRRARHLHRAAQAVCERHGGTFPSDPALLVQLPGVGRSTAAAIAVFAGGQRAAILDGNVRRVFCRHDAIDGDPASARVLQRLWTIAEQRLPHRQLIPYTQGLMDLGATVCTRSRPACPRCPVSSSCAALAQGDPLAYPSPRRARPVPTRELAPLLLVAGGSVLLQRRPDSGIWAGLWGLPECRDAPADRQRMLALAGELLGAALPAAAARSLETLEGFEHALTHFRLRISPWRLQLSELMIPRETANVLVAREASAQEATRPVAYRWLPLAAWEQAALPQPVRRLLSAEAQRLKAPDAAPAPAGSDSGEAADR